MSRIRTIKPEFWTSEQVISCSRDARLMFIGLWNFCDDNGVHTASLVRVKAEIFPADNISISEISSLIEELKLHKLLIEYEVEDHKYWMVTGWKLHQKIDRPNPKHPVFPGEEAKKFDECSTNDRRGLDERSPPEGKGREGKGEERNGMDKDTSALPPQILEVFEFWKLTTGHKKAVLDKKRKTKIVDALKKYSIEDVKKAIVGNKNDKWHSDNGVDELTYILRDSPHIERFLGGGEKNSVKSDVLKRYGYVDPT